MEVNLRSAELPLEFNSFNDCKRYICIHIFNHILDLAWSKWVKLPLELHSQYHACWCSGNFRSQGISRHGTDPQIRNIPSTPSEELSCFDKAPIGRCDYIVWTNNFSVHSDDHGYSPKFVILLLPSISNIRRTKSQDLNVSHLILQLSLPNPLKPGIKWRMKL